MGIRSVLALAVLAVIGLTPVVASAGTYILPFVPTQNAPGGIGGGAEGTMRIRVEDGKSTVRLRVRGLYPRTVYTIWTVFNKLHWNPVTATGHSVGSCPANGPDLDKPATHSCSSRNWNGWANFPAEGNGVSPTAKVTARFTDGMGLDPGATFTTDENGDGTVNVELDYVVVNQAPIGNADITRQTLCLRGPHLAEPCTYKSLRITTTYLRTFIGEFKVRDRARMCANYAPNADPEVVGASNIASGVDARQWQCIDPKTGVPRVPRFGFDHFPLANHPDDMTLGFIGGNAADHWIDMVGTRACLTPGVPSLPTPGGITADYPCPVPASSLNVDD